MGTDIEITGLDEEVWKGPATVKNKRLLISTDINDLTPFLQKPSQTPFPSQQRAPDNR